MLTIWRLARTRQQQVDILLGDDLQLQAAA
jgi:hypothetical protein